MSQVSEISERIEAVLQSQQVDEACEKCCSFLKRIKESLVKYRAYLSEQESQLDGLYEQYKQVFVGA